jgi:hypothetical protein
MQPSIQEWRELYDAAVTFRDAAPWRWMWDSNVFGVQDPEGGQIGYCCVMGQLGEHLALAVYQGSEGLAGLWQMRETGPRAQQDPLAVLLLQECLMASFEDRTMLHKRDLDVIKALGLKFRGRQAWPHFQSYRPGYAPWFLTAPEARFLTVCLPQALDVAARFRENPALLPDPEPDPQGLYLVRVPEKRGAEWVWKDTVQRPAPVRPSAATPPPLDEARLRQLRELPSTRGVLQMDYFYTGAAVKGEEEDERPWYPQILLAADATSGLILGMELVRTDEVPATLVKQLLDIVERMGQRPDRIEVRQEEARLMLKPAVERLGTRVIRVRRMPAVDSARRELGQFLDR